MKRTKPSPSLHSRLTPTSLACSHSTGSTPGHTGHQPPAPTGHVTHSTSLGNLTQPTNHRPLVILRLPEVARRLGIKRSTVYAKMAPGRYFDASFPRPVPLSAPSDAPPKPGAPSRKATAVGWIEEEIEAWLSARMAERDTTLALQGDLNKGDLNKGALNKKGAEQ